jgi:hydroxymethylbilane synthase
MVLELARAAGIACELVVVRTSGDRIQDRPLADVGGKGLFTKELEELLLKGDIDLAVHSMKDVPAELPIGLSIAAVLPREDVRDAFLSPIAASLDTLPEGARVGTSSVRRAAQVARARPDLEILSLRGNVDTRLAKLDAGTFDAILLAYAGLKRLGLESRITSLFPTDTWLPALSQGAVGIQIAKQDDAVVEWLRGVNDSMSEIALACERAFQLALDGSCRTAIGGLATITDGVLAFRGEVLAPDGHDFAVTEFTKELGASPLEDAAAAGREAGLALKPRAAPWLKV